MTTTMGAIDKKFNARLGALLKEGRMKAGLTQRQLAEKLGYTSPQYVSNWERGRVAPPVYILPKVARATKVNAETIQKILVEHTTQKYKEAFKHPNSLKPRYH